MWSLWLNALLGIWLIFIAVANHMSGWTVGVTGLAVSFLAFWTLAHRGPGEDLETVSPGEQVYTDEDIYSE